MKLHLTTAEDNFLITAYGDRFIEINRQRYTVSLIVMPKELIQDWPVAHFGELTQAHFAKILELKPEIVLLGTGQQHRFLHPEITQQLTNGGLAIECMTTAAACRTYNILMSEGRNVVAALLI